MTDPVVPPVEPAPVVTTTVEVPAIESTPVPAAEPETIIGNEPVVEAPKVEEKPAEVTPPVVEPKPDEAKPAEDPKPVEEAKPAEDKATLPAFEKFTTPEGISLNEKVLGEFTSMLGSFESVSKAEHAEVQKFGQALVDYHTSRLNDAIADLTKQYEASWKKQTEDWRTQFESDPEIGGNRKDSTVKAAEDFIRTHGGSEDQQKELRALLRKTGLGNHPAIIRSYANAGLSKMLTEGSPVPAQAPSPSKMTRAQKMYGVKK